MPPNGVMSQLSCPSDRAPGSPLSIARIVVARLDLPRTPARSSMSFPRSIRVLRLMSVLSCPDQSRDRCASNRGADSVMVTARHFQRRRVPPVPRRKAADGVRRPGTPPSRASAVAAAQLEYLRSFGLFGLWTNHETGGRPAGRPPRGPPPARPALSAQCQHEPPR